MWPFQKKPRGVLNIASYKAPELTGLGQWIQGPETSLAALKGNVVLIDFWTFGCINCVHTLPHVEGWYRQYKDRGFTVIGVHTPEFDAEYEPENVTRQVAFRKLTYPIVQDNNYATWQAYNNHYWPAQYLIDKSGKVRRTHFGEGEYAETAQAIEQLLAE